VLILADTVKGKGVRFAENITGYHGITPKDGRCGPESLEQSIFDIYGGSETPFPKEKIDSLLNLAEEHQMEVDKKLKALLPVFKQNYWWNETGSMMVKMDPTRMGFGRALEKLGADERIIAFGADITSSIKMMIFTRPS
jgi:transketolase